MKMQVWSRARTTRLAEDSHLNGIGGGGCLITVKFGQSPGDGEEASSTDVSRMLQTQGGEGQSMQRRQCAVHT